MQLNSKAIVQLSWDKLLNFNKKYLDRTANRIYGLDSNTINVKLIGDNIPINIQLSNHPKNTSFGTRTMAITNELTVEAKDFSEACIGDRYTLVGFGNTTIVCTNPLTIEYNAADKDFRSTIKITWLPNNEDTIPVTIKIFGQLLSKAKMSVEDNIMDIFNAESLSTQTMLVESSIKNFPQGSIVQIMRKGYYYVDNNNANDIILHAIP